MVDILNTTEPEKPRGHWFRFRLRSLLVGVALLGAVSAYVAHAAITTAERKAMLRRLATDQTRHVWIVAALDSERVVLPVPWVRRLFDDYAIEQFYLPSDTSLEDRRRIKGLFPEAKLFLNELGPGNEPQPFPEE